MKLLCALIGTLMVANAALPNQPFKRDQLVGTWMYSMAYTEFPDGRRIDQFKANPYGMFLIAENGTYAHVLLSRGRPKVQSGTLKGAPNHDLRTLSEGVLAHYGSYTVNENAGTFTVTIDGSSFPNFEGVRQTRTILKLNDEELMYVNHLSPAGGGAKVVAALKRRVN
jgi:Lipocalin-like domain